MPSIFGKLLCQFAAVGVLATDSIDTANAVKSIARPVERHHGGNMRMIPSEAPKAKGRLLAAHAASAEGYTPELREVGPEGGWVTIHL